MTAMRKDHENLGALLQNVRDIATTFHEGLADRPVTRDLSAAGELSDALPDSGEGGAAALERFSREIEPHLSASVGPRYLAFVTGGATPAAIAGDWLAAACDNSASMAAGSIANRVTRQTLDWMLELFDLPGRDSDAGFDGCFTSGATASNLLGVLSAREWCGRMLGIDVAANGAMALPAIPVLSACPHASMIKALSIAGFGRECVIPVDRVPGTEAMDPAALERALGGLGARPNGGPKIVIASAGTVTGTDFDDLNAIADICAANNAWLHVDGAFGIFVRCMPATPEHDRAKWANGLERVDSITGDSHKWLNVPYDSGFFFTRHLDLLERVCSLGAAYLVTGEADPAYMLRGIESSQRFRALPAWMTLAAYGREGVREVVENNCAQATRLGAWIDANTDWSLLKPVNLNVIVFRSVRANDQKAALDALNATGKVYASPGAWDGQPGIRICFSNWITQDADVAIVEEALEAAASAIG